MKRRTLWYGIGGLLAGLLLGVLWGIVRPQTTSAPTTNTTLQNTNSSSIGNINSATNVNGVTTFSTSDLPDRDSAFSFSTSIPTTWAVEYIPGSQAINIYDPRGQAASTLENSKIFIKYFSADKFLTLTTVDILSQTSLTIATRPAVAYVIKKKASAANFSNQPTWRNLEHRVTDIRSTDANPTIFYVFAKAPDVPDATFDAVLAALRFSPDAELSSVYYPLQDFLPRITKKRFGQYITPQNSPVSPERFSGYHTGVDAEAGDDQGDVPVYAVANGQVKLRRTVDGYGGVVMIEQAVDGQTLTALYGHLDIASVTLTVGDVVTAGQKIGVLGTGGTAETDGERQHLHFGLLVGVSTNLKGYVSRDSDLSPWLDPLIWFAEQRATEVTPT